MSPISQTTASLRGVERGLRLVGSERLSFIAQDLERTHRFYTEALLLPLVYAETGDHLPDGRHAPHVEVRYALADGSTLAFVCFRDSPPEPARRLHPLRHFAFAVQDVPTLLRWKAHLLAQGVEVIGEIDHGVVKSIYFHDPNEIRMELSTDLIVYDDEEARKARQTYEAWWTLGVTEQHTPVGGHAGAQR